MTLWSFIDKDECIKPYSSNCMGRVCIAVFETRGMAPGSSESILVGPSASWLESSLNELSQVHNVCYQVGSNLFGDWVASRYGIEIFWCTRVWELY